MSQPKNPEKPENHDYDPSTLINEQQFDQLTQKLKDLASLAGEPKVESIEFPPRDDESDNMWAEYEAHWTALGEGRSVEPEDIKEINRKQDEEGNGTVVSILDAHFQFAGCDIWVDRFETISGGYPFNTAKLMVKYPREADPNGNYSYTGFKCEVFLDTRKGTMEDFVDVYDASGKKLNRITDEHVAKVAEHALKRQELKAQGFPEDKMAEWNDRARALGFDRDLNQYDYRMMMKTLDKIGPEHLVTGKD